MLHEAAAAQEQKIKNISTNIINQSINRFISGSIHSKARTE